MSDPRNRFKVDVNARSMGLTGCIILHKKMNIIIVEGGPKMIRKFKKLMTQRVNWNREKEDEDDNSRKKKEGQENGEEKKGEDNNNAMDTGEKEPVKCDLIWEVTINILNRDHNA